MTGEVQPGVGEVPPEPLAGVVLGLVLVAVGGVPRASDVRVLVAGLHHAAHVQPEATVGALQEEPVVPTRGDPRVAEGGPGVGVGQHIVHDPPDLGGPTLGEPELAVGRLELPNATLKGVVLLLELGQAIRHGLEGEIVAVNRSRTASSGERGTGHEGEGHPGGDRRSPPVSHPAHVNPRGL